MKNKKKLILVIALAVLLIAAAVVACLFIFGGKNSGRTSITFEGIEEIHAPVGTVTEESLLAGVTAKDNKGNSKSVTVDLGGADFNKPGRYVIEYKCGEEIKREVVYIYGDISYQVNEENLEGNAVEIPFANAITSLNFTKIVSATDSFGNELEVVKVEGDPFDYLTGEYTVKYTATDKAGKTLEKTVTYTVTSNINMTVQADVSVKYEQESVTFKVDLDGEKDIWLMANGGLVSIADYAMTEKGLVLNASYFRTLAPGENTLKLCSMNGSTVFTFTVVDTGKPLFTFDSIYKTYIIAGNAAVYEMPQTQIAGHEYSYTYKITKDGVSYKAQQVGDSILITTSSGKNLGPGMYDITVTATNKADTSKKTTIKRDFRIYTNQAEIDGWKFGNDGNGSQMVNVDLSDEGYYRTAWQYTAKSPNSWNNRVFWQKVTKATFQTITFDFKITSLGVAEKENGPVKFVSKSAKAEIPFHTSTMSGEGVARIFYDMNGNVVAQEDLKMNTWYTVKMDVSEILHPKSESTDLAWYFGVSNKWQATMLITEMHFWAYEGTGTQNVFKDDAKTVSIERNGGKSNFASATLDDEKVMMYTVTDKHIPGTAIKRALKVSLLDTSKEVVSIDFKYLEEVKDVNGNVLDLSMYVHDVELRNDGVFGANYAIVDAETGEPTVKMEVGKWYTLYITTHGRKTYTIYPMGKADTQLTCKVAFKNLQTYDVDMPSALLFSDSGNIAPSGMYKMPDGEWGISYASYTGWDATANTAYYRRIVAKLNSDKYSEIRFQFRYTVSAYKDMESSMMVNDLKFVAPNITIVDENFNPVEEKDRKIGQWYTAVIASSDGSPLAKAIEMYPQGYNDGGQNEKIVNVEMQFRDIVAVETKPIPVHTNDDNTVSLQAASGKSDLSAGVDAEAGMLVYTNTKEQMPSAPDSRALLLKVLAEDKNIVKFSFKFESATAPDGTPLSPDMYVADELRGGYWRRAESAITDENGKPVANLEVGKWYTMWITTEGQTEFRVYPMGMIGDQQVLCKMLVKDMETAEAEIGGAHFVSNDGGTFGAVGLYQNGEDKWEYFGSAYDRYSSWIPGYNGQPKNLADYRKIRLSLDADDYVVASFEFQYQVSRYIKLEEGAEWTNNLALISGATGHTLTVLDADGNEVAAADRQLGVWYTAIIKKTDGSALSQSIPLYTCGYSGTNDNQSVEMEILLRNPKAAKGNVIYTNADNTLSIQSAGMVDALSSDENGIYYKMDKTTAATTTMADRALTIKRLEGNTKGLIKLELVLNSAKDQNDQNVEPWVVVENASGWFTYVLTDKDGNAVKYLKADGNSYFLYITAKDPRPEDKAADNTAFTFYPVGRSGEQVYADLTIKSMEAIEVADSIVTMVLPDNWPYANLAIYQDENGRQYAYQSDNELYCEYNGNTSWARRFNIKLDRADYLSLAFQIRYVESKYDGNTMHNLYISGCDVSYFDADFNSVAAADLQDGVWYNVIVSKKGGGALPANINDNLIVTQADSPIEFGAGKFVQVLMQVRNFKGISAESIGIFSNDDNSVSYQSAGAISTLSREEGTEEVRYQLLQEKLPYTMADKAIKLTLNDTTKEVISVKFTVNTLTDPSGGVLNPWVRVTTANGYDGNYVVIDENGNSCKTVEAGKTYTLFITAPENAYTTDALYNQPANPTEFVIYLMGREDNQQLADISITEIATHDVAAVSSVGGNLTYQTKLIHGNASYYQVGDKWNLAYASYYDLYRSSPTPTNNSAENREFIIKHGGTNIEELRFKIRFVESTANGAPNFNLAANGGHTVTFYKDGAVVTTREAGVWYDVAITKSGGVVAEEFKLYGGSYSNDYPVNFQYQIADVELLTADTNPIKLAPATGTYGAMQRKANGDIIYQTNAVAANTSAYNRRFNITSPADAKLIRFDFVFDICEDASGNPVTPNLYAFVNENNSKKGHAVVTDQNGNPVFDLTVGTKYTMWITTNGNTAQEICVVGNSTAALKAKITISNRQVVDVTTGAMTFTPNAATHGPVAMYMVGEELRYGFTLRTGIQNVPTTGGAYTRRLFMNLDQSTYTKASFEFMYTVAEVVAADATVTTGGKMAASGAKYYTMDGVEVTDGKFTVNTWYKAEFVNDAGLPAKTEVYPMAYTEKPDGGQLNAIMAIRNLFVPIEDTNPVTIASTEKSWVTLTYEMVAGQLGYSFNSTEYAAANSSSGWQRSFTLTNPLNKAAVLTLDFKFLSNSDSVGNLAAYTSATAPASYAIMEKDTGKLVGDCEVGKAYRLFINVDANATVRVHTNVGHSGTSAFKLIFTDRQALEAPTGDVSMSVNSIYYATIANYCVDGEWRYGYTSYAGTLQSLNAQAADYRHIKVKQTASTYDQISFEFKYDVSQSVAADGTVTQVNKRFDVSGLNKKFYTLDGVETSTFTVGTWYKAVISPTSGTFGASFSLYTMMYDLAPEGGKLQMTMSFRNIKALKPDTSNVGIRTTETAWVSLTRDSVDGVQGYQFTTTAKSAIDSSAGWQRSYKLTNPLATDAVLIQDFKFISSTDGEGNAIVPNLYGGSGKYVVIEKATGKQVGACEIGKEYTLFVLAAANEEVTVYMNQGYNGPIKASVFLGNREAVAAPAMGNVVFEAASLTYGALGLYRVDGEWYYGFTHYSGVQGRHASGQYYRRLFMKQPADTYKAVTFQFKYDVAETVDAEGTVTQVSEPLNISGAKYYTADGTEVTDGKFTLGTWYNVVVYNANNLPASLEAYPVGNANYTGDGNIRITASFRNLKGVKEEVTFATPGTLADPTTSVGPYGFEYSIVGNSVVSGQRKLTATMANGNATELAFEIKLSNKKGVASYSIAGTDTTLQVKYYDATNAEVTSLTENTWYKMVITKKDGSALGTTALNLGMLGGQLPQPGAVDVVIRNVVVTAP